MADMLQVRRTWWRTRILLLLLGKVAIHRPVVGKCGASDQGQAQLYLVDGWVEHRHRESERVVYPALMLSYTKFGDTNKQTQMHAGRPLISLY